MTGSLALLVRSLRVDARLLRTHLFRGLFVLLIYCCLYIAQEMSFIRSAPGLNFFESIVMLNFLMLTAAGTSYFATVITEEKEEGTLGLLRMAGISPVGLLLGKAVPRLMAAGLLLSVQFPFTFLAITLGGVTAHQVVAAYVALLAYLALLAMLGLLCSVVFRRSQSASWQMVLVLVVFLAVIPIARMIFPSPPWWTTPLAQWVSEALDWISAASVLLRMRSIMQTGFADPVFSYQVWSNLAAAGVFFLLAWATFDRFNRHDLPDAPARPRLFRSGVGRRRLGVSRAWGKALIWKEFHFGAGGRTMMITKFVAYGLVIAGFAWLFYWLEPTRFDADHVGGLMMMSMFIVLVAEPALYASRIFHDELKWRTLTSLLLLPSSTAHVAYSKVAGSLLALAPAAAWMLLGAILNPSDLGEALEEMFLKESAGWYLLSQYLLFLHLTVLLSLFIKWGSLPLAFVGLYVGNMLVIGMISLGTRGPGEGVFGFLAFMGFCALVPMQIAIGARLRALSGQ